MAIHPGTVECKYRHCSNRQPNRRVNSNSSAPTEPDSGINLKLVTTATALEVFGPDFRFQTVLSYSEQSATTRFSATCKSSAAAIRPWAPNTFRRATGFRNNGLPLCKVKTSESSPATVLDAGIYESQTIPDNGSGKT